MYTCTCDCICRPCVSIHAACLCVKGCLSLPSLCRASEGAALAAVRALHNLCAGNKKGQRHVVVAGGVDALLERLRHTYRQGMRRRGEAAAADSVLKEAAASALRNSLVDHVDAQALLFGQGGLVMMLQMLTGSWGMSHAEHYTSPVVQNSSPTTAETQRGLFQTPTRFTVHACLFASVCTL